MILTLAATKGGVGKTTLAIYLAALAARRGARTVLVDADPQQSALTWARVVDPAVPVRAMPAPRDLAAWRDQWDLIVIDTAGAIIPEVTAAVEAADAVLMPCGASALDLWASRALVEAVTRTQTPIAAVVTGATVGTELSRQARAAVETLGIDVTEARIARRVDFAQALLDDRLPTGVAGVELAELYDELEAAGWVPAGTRETTTEV